MSETGHTRETHLIGEAANLDEAALNELQSAYPRSARRRLFRAHPEAIVLLSANDQDKHYVELLTNNFMKDFPPQDTMRAKLHKFATGSEVTDRDALVFISFSVPPRDLAIASIVAVTRCNSLLEGVASPLRLPEL